MNQGVAVPLPWHEAVFSRWAVRQVSDRAAHAYLVVAPEGTGGERLLEAMAASVLCERVSLGSLVPACGVCASCALVAAFSHPDVRVLRPSILEMGHPVEELRPVKPSKEISVDDVRDVSNMVHQTSHRGGQRVVLVYPAGRLNRSAANALLKTLEEPPANMVFFLLVSDVQQVLPTIVSRCQLLNAGVPSLAESVGYLNGVGSDLDWEACVRGEGGAVMRVAQLADSDYFSVRARFVAALARGRGLDVVVVAAAFEKLVKDADKARLAGAPKSVDASILVEWLQRWLADLVLRAQVGSAPRFFVREVADLDALVASAGVRFLEEAHAFGVRLQEERRLADYPLNLRSWIEGLLLGYVALF